MQLLTLLHTLAGLAPGVVFVGALAYGLYRANHAAPFGTNGKGARRG